CTWPHRSLRPNSGTAAPREVITHEAPRMVSLQRGFPSTGATRSAATKSSKTLRTARTGRSFLATSFSMLSSTPGSNWARITARVLSAIKSDVTASRCPWFEVFRIEGPDHARSAVASRFKVARSFDHGYAAEQSTSESPLVSLGTRLRRKRLGSTVRESRNAIESIDRKSTRL